METGLTGEVALVCAASHGTRESRGARPGRRRRAGGDLRAHMPTLEATAAEIQAATGAEVLAIAADLSRRSDISRLVHQTVQHFGGLDILVTNSRRAEGRPVRAR